MYKIKYVQFDKNFIIKINKNSNLSLLDIAEKNNLFLPYSCRVGACSVCLGQIVSGNYKQEQYFLDDSNIKKGYCLTCVTYPLSDLTVLTHQEDKLF